MQVDDAIDKTIETNITLLGSDLFWYSISLSVIFTVTIIFILHLFKKIRTKNKSKHV